MTADVINPATEKTTETKNTFISTED